MLNVFTDLRTVTYYGNLCPVKHQASFDHIELTYLLVIVFFCNSRKLLYDLSEGITVGDLKHVKFLLNNKLPRRKLEDNIVSHCQCL